MLGVRFLSLVVIVAALLVARVALSTDVPCSDRAEIPGGQGNSDGSNDGDSLDLALPSRTTLTAVSSPIQRLLVEAQRTPATSAFALRIFRPPISALA